MAAKKKTVKKQPKTTKLVEKTTAKSKPKIIAKSKRKGTNFPPKGVTPPQLEGKGWKPGVSGNPSGRPKFSNTLGGAFERIGQELLHDSCEIHENLKRKFRDKKDITKKEALLRIIYIKALKGEQWAAHFIADRIEGKPKEYHVVEERKLTVGLEGKQEIYEEPPIGEEIGEDDIETDY